MERFIHNENIHRYRKLLAEEQNEEKRNIIRKLLAEEEAKDVPASPGRRRGNLALKDATHPAMGPKCVSFDDER